MDRVAQSASPERADFFRLACSSIAARALAMPDLLERVIAHKSFFFASSWAHYETARPGTFRLLPDQAVRDGLKRDYEAMEPMLFGEVPPWPSVVATLEQLERRINGLAV